MEKKRIVLLPVLITVFLVLLPIFFWYLGDKREINIVVIDKTVPDNTYREHKALFWLLNNQKIVKKDSRNFYNYKKDYYGFFPENPPSERIKKLPVIEEKVDLIYIADTYGVYKEDLGGQNLTGERSELIYGGITLEEVERIKRLAYQGTTVIAEFNTFASQTDLRAKNALYDLLGLRWTGWIGRYFPDLSIGGEVPVWVVRNYEAQQNKPWEFEKSGFVFVNEEDKVVVLEREDYLKSGIEFSWTKRGQEFLGKKDIFSYRYWVDIVLPYRDSEILAMYNLHLTETGREKLAKENIPLEFPAVIRNNTGLYTTYYFAGDYADNLNTPAFHQVAGFTTFMEKLPLRKDENFFWKTYVPMMKKILNEASQNRETLAIKEGFVLPYQREVYKEGNTKLVSRTSGEKLQIYSEGKWQDIFVKGVNLGIALPGRWFTEFPKEESIYLDWFYDIGQMNANVVRVYTLMDPSFYRALLRYNVKNPDKPLWLLQEIWPEEHPPDDDYLKEEYVQEFFREIEYVIDSIHGNIEIPERKDRAYGYYDADVSPYVLGILIGRELEPHEVIATNEKNDVTTFKGDYIVVEKGSPTEVWLAKSMEHTLAYGEKKYNWQHPVAIVSWPTLDVMEHDAEWNEAGKKELEYNDKVSIDIRNFQHGQKMKAGLFGAYHIYPNYPDFMNNTLEYSNYKDEEGVFRYGGYLQHFMEHHRGYPALVAEFGLATGMGNAHQNPDGYNHGGLSEKEQGLGIVRMMEAIRREGYAGGVIFEWMDEWAKKTWTTEPFIIPYEHNVFWHNAIDPEQNYGILALESIRPDEPQMVVKGKGALKHIELAGNEGFLYLSIYSTETIDLNVNKILIGIDTYDPEKGSFRYARNIDVLSPTGMEFLITLTGESGSLKVIPEYNISRYSFASVPNSKGPFETINPIINKRRVTKDGRVIEEIREEASLLKKGNWLGEPNHWYTEKEAIHLRIPWGRLNVTDPTTYRVLDDPGKYFDYPASDTFKTAITEGFRITVLLLNEKDEIIATIPERLDLPPVLFKWETWGEPRYRNRLKESYYIIQSYFRELENKIK